MAERRAKARRSPRASHDATTQVRAGLRAKRARPRATDPQDAGIAALERWFATRGWRVFDFQREAWRAYLAGESGLVHAPTGYGKTLAVWGGPLAEALRERGDMPLHEELQPRSNPVSERAPPPRARRTRRARILRVLWVTPLRALASDTLQNLRDAAAGVGLDWRIERRTGDSTSGERGRVKRGEADVLVTTPESLSLMLSYPDAAERFASLRCVIADEWHELLGTKRGVQLQLCLARLRRLAPLLRTWGLSATLGNLPEARDVLLGAGAHGRLVDAVHDKRIVVESLLPADPARFPWAGHLGLQQLPQVLARVLAARTTLVFTNTRSQAELWHQALESIWPDDPATLALHHGSLDRGLRAEVEAGLREGRIRCVVATSSLDLGVDFTAVDQVVQISSPKGVARLAQRAGRSGHSPGATSRVVCVPTHTLELVEIAAARRALADGAIEARTPPRLSLDVLAQHLVTIALGGGFTAQEMLAEVRTTHAFAPLPEPAWEATLELVTRGGRALAAYPDFHKVVERDGRYVVEAPRIARLHRLSIGTITSDGMVAVKNARGRTLGQVEEQFIARLKPGDRFLFAGRSLELIRVRDMVAHVRAAKERFGTVPRWLGGKMPLTTELARYVEKLLSEPDAPEPEMRAARPLLAAQASRSHLPAPGELLVEWLRARDGDHLFVYPFAGRQVHEGLAALLAYRLSRATPTSFSWNMNDYGLMLSARRHALPSLDALRDALSPDGLAQDLVASLNLGELARRQFREIARVAGLVFQGLPGHAKTMRQLQASSGLIYDVLAEHDPEHVLMRQAVDEVLANQLEYRRLADALALVATRTIVIETPKTLTPLSFPLWADFVRGTLSSEDWLTRVRAMAERLEASA
ncbi:MAG TPA: ligase-associated DNA damage response DEXH box helicase [Xanthomonadales bacterium]|nr:ligase-associated DNA damage response DEXH box helicase [Xanthomonadales bacterium]